MNAVESSSRKTADDPGKNNGSNRSGLRLNLVRRIFFFGDDDFEGEASLLDISTSGCRASSSTEVTVDTILKLSIFLQDQPWPLRIDEAVVRWVDGPSFGLEFVGIRPAQRERIRAIVMNARKAAGH